MLKIDKIAYSNRLTAFNPKAKFAVFVATLLSALVVENLLVYIGIIILIWITLALFAGIDGKRYLKLFKIPSAFLLMSIATILISVSDGKSDFVYAVNIGSYYIGVLESSIHQCSILFFRALACLSSMYFLALTLPINQLLKVLRDLKVPVVILEIAMLVYRFIMMFLEEYEDMQVAIYLKFGYGNLKTSYKSISLLVVNLFKRMMYRYEQLEVSLDVKLYNGNFHV